MRFRYLRDPVFLSAVVLFALTKFLKAYTANAFVHGYAADVLCLPLWVPVMLTGMRLTRLRAHDLPPQPFEILIPLLLWSVLFEVWLPQTATFQRVATADPLDVVAYTAGALLAALAWALIYRRPSVSADTP